MKNANIPIHTEFNRIKLNASFGFPTRLNNPKINALEMINEIKANIFNKLGLK